jgi:hypothetical protein
VKVTGSKASGITNYLNFSSLRNRIIMMNKVKSKKSHLFIFILWFPVVLLLLLTFRHENEKQNHFPEDKNPSSSTFTLSSLTYAVTDHKIEAIVKKEHDKSWLRVGETFDLSLVSYEKERLQDLLKRNGYDVMQKQAITFLIDTSSSRNNFSVQVNINVIQPKVSMLKKVETHPEESLHVAMNSQELNENNTGTKASIAGPIMKK